MSSPSTKSVEHTVKSGETLEGIRRQHGVTLEALLTAKKKFPDLSDVEQLQAAVSRYNGGAGLRHPTRTRAQPAVTI